MNINFTSQTQVRVRYGETDQMGYCYYGNYAQFFEIGRVEAMRDIGMSYRELEERGVMLPVSTFSINYKSPARYDDLLEIETTITLVTGARIQFDYIIRCEEKLICTATTVLVFVSKDSMRPIPAPNYFLQLVEPHKSQV